jgi:hypothetical protein
MKADSVSILPLNSDLDRPIFFFLTGFPTTIFSKFSSCPMRAACTFSVFLF